MDRIAVRSVLLLLLLGTVDAVRPQRALRRPLLATSLAQNATSVQVAPATFEGFYNSHTKGRGIWKWGNALVAYQRHFGSAWAGHPVKFAEVGVQSGGSILMWQAVLGQQCHVYGIDINTACGKFADPTTTITIGDQADVAMWTKFFTETTPNLDVLVDDGGHTPTQMLVTLQQVFPRTNPGGFVAIEDIHGTHYVNSFFHPAATFLGQQSAQGLLKAVHVYPFLLVAEKGGTSSLPASDLALAPAATVNSFEALWSALPANVGKSVAVVNPGWGSLLTEVNLKGIFSQFGSLHAYESKDTPPGCATTPVAVCTMTVVNSQGQNSITGVHVFSDRLIVEVAATPPVIHAVRKGTEWLPYGF